MEKSIETIWKEGFLQADALIAPRVNDLYNKKSIHIIDRFKRMFRINLRAIMVGAIGFLGVSWLMGIFSTGIIFFITLMYVLVVNKQLQKGIEKIDTGDNSYQYLQSFKSWLSRMVNINKQMSNVIYPVFTLGILMGIWLKEENGQSLGNRLSEIIVQQYPDIQLIYGVPWPILAIALLLLGLMALLGGKIYLWDVNVIYGRVFSKLDELLADIESLEKP